MSIKSRRAKRKAARKLRQDGPAKSVYGGEEGAVLQFRKDLRKEKKVADDREEKEYKQVTEAREHATTEEKRARNDREFAGSRTREALSNVDDAIRNNDIGAGAASARALRENALAKNPLTASAETAIKANQANAQQQLAQSIGLQNRQARGLAGSMGEGGALGMQQALASAGAGAADLAAMNQTEQAKLAADMRYNAAEQERAAQLGFAGQSADEQYNAALQQMQAQQQQAAARAGVQQLETGRHLQSAQMANAMSAGTFDAATSGKQQAFANQQGLEGTLYGIQQQQNQQAYEAAKNRGAAAFFGKIANVGNNIEAAIDSSDMGFADKLMGKTKAY